jgi:hypothetical protein
MAVARSVQEQQDSGFADKRFTSNLKHEKYSNV